MYRFRLQLLIITQQFDIGEFGKFNPLNRIICSIVCAYVMYLLSVLIDQNLIVMDNLGLHNILIPIYNTYW